MAFADLASELTGNLPGLSPFLADSYIIRAYRKIRDARLWSFLMTDDSIICPVAVSTGAISITYGNNLVTANAAASAALTALFGVPVPAQFLQLVWGGQGATSQTYSIVSVDATVPTALAITLDRAVVEATDANSAYQCYRAYVAAPVPDFLRWESVVDMVNGWPLRLDRTSTNFDQIDPQRQTQDQAYYCGFYKNSYDQPPVPIYELWPRPVSGQTFYVRYQRRGADFVAPTDVQASVIPDDLIMQAALGFYAYPWAMANPGHFPALAKINWFQLIQDAKKTYQLLLIDAKRQDDNQAMTSVLNRGHRLRGNPLPTYPVDANFIQSHLVPL